MGYISSDNIHAFPVASRGPGFPYSRLTTEYNLTQNLRITSSKDGYILKSGSNLSDDFVVGIIIFGYYFETSIGAIKTAIWGNTDPSGSGTVYATVEVGSSGETQEILNQETHLPAVLDSDSKFQGISFTTTAPLVSEETYSSYSLKVFDYVVTNNTPDISIPSDYCYKFNSKDVDLTWQSLN